jgi:hypothetical protein
MQCVVPQDYTVPRELYRFSTEDLFTVSTHMQPRLVAAPA